MTIRFHAGVAAAAFGLAAALMTVPAANAAETQFKIALSGKKETPPNTTAGTGTGTATYDDSSHSFSWNITYSGLTGDPSAAHFHGPAGPGKAAPPTVPIDASALKSPITGQATLTDDQAKQLLADQWYFNVHTAANPKGEIRGQVLKSKAAAGSTAPAGGNQD